MTTCSGGDRRFRGVQTGRWITIDADSSGGSSAPRPARPAQQHPLQQTESSEKSKTRVPYQPISGEWCCRLARQGSRRRPASPQLSERTTKQINDPPLSLQASKRSSSTKAPVRFILSSKPIRPLAGQTAASLAAPTRRHHKTLISSWASVDHELRLHIWSLPSANKRLQCR